MLSSASRGRWWIIISEYQVEDSEDDRRHEGFSDDDRWEQQKADEAGDQDCDGRPAGGVRHRSTRVVRSGFEVTVCHIWDT